MGEGSPVPLGQVSAQAASLQEESDQGTQARGPLPAGGRGRHSQDTEPGQLLAHLRGQPPEARTGQGPAGRTEQGWHRPGPCRPRSLPVPPLWPDADVGAQS